jgi:UDP-2-acetamido-3-amino-2,3-dideoxy-glucuronate N-acetyltransferase
MMNSIALVGCGYWGKNLVRNFHHLGALKLICDKNETLLDQFQEQYSDIDTCLAFNEVLLRKDIHGVVISAPAEMHYSLALEALLAGKHVYVEKPLTLVEEEGEELIALAEKMNLVLMVGHLLQYHPVFIQLKNIVRKGDLGRINYIYSNRLNLGKIRREENALWSFAPHDISMILSLAGEMPETVFATGGYFLHKKIADVTTTHLEFSSGLRAHIFVSWLHPFTEQKLVVVGDKKMDVFDDTKSWEDKLLLYPHEIRWDNNIPIPEKAEAERLDIPQSEPLREECQHFLDCISEGRQPVTDGQEGLEVLRVLNASQESLDKNGLKICIEDKSDNVPMAGKRSSEIELKNEYFSHPTSIIDDGCEIGSGTKIWHFSHVLPGSEIGERCNIGQNVVIGPDVSIGKGCKIQNNVSVYKGVTLEDEVFCGPSMVFTNIYNPRAGIRKMDQVRPTLVKKGATIGANSTIVCGTTIGRYAFIGAGALVNRNVPNHALTAGNPAKIIGWVCDCGDRLTDNNECPVCEKKYERNDDGLTSVE